MKNIVIINGNPTGNSFCQELALTYKKAAEKNSAKCTLINLSELKFDPILRDGYRKRSKLEPDLQSAQNAISNANHLVFVYPTWWGTYPALLKGFIDRVFLPGFAFKYRENSVLWDKLLKGKSARLIVTMDAPKWYYKIITKAPGHNSMKRNILHFCGIKPVKITTFDTVKIANRTKRNTWIKKVDLLGSKQI